LVLQNLIESRQRDGSITFLLEAQSFFKQRLVTPMNRPFLIGSQLVVGLNGTLITTRIRCTSLEENVALPAKRLAFFGRGGVTVQNLIIQGESVFRFPKLALDHRLFVARSPAHCAVLLHHL